MSRHTTFAIDAQGRAWTYRFAGLAGDWEVRRDGRFVTSYRRETEAHAHVEREVNATFGRTYE